MEQTNKITPEIALEELEVFLASHIRRPEKGDEAKEKYSNIYDAIIEGRLIIEEEKVQYKLLKPIENDSGSVTLDTVSFKTRIKPSDQAGIGKGIDVQKEPAKYGLLLLAHIIDQPKAMLDKFHKWDYNIINEIAMVFL